MKIASGANSAIPLDRNDDARAPATRSTALACIITPYRATGSTRARRPASTRTQWARTLAADHPHGQDHHRTRGDHGQIRSGKACGLLVDEWGTWYDVEPGTNPGFLYQQNSLRDAIVASLNFNIFARHTDRLRGANIAQMVNVLPVDAPHRRRQDGEDPNLLGVRHVQGLSGRDGLGGRRRRADRTARTGLR